MANVSTFICSPNFIIEYPLSDGLNIQNSLDKHDLQQLISNKEDHWLDLALDMAMGGQPVLNWGFSPDKSDLPDQLYLSLFTWLDRVFIRLSDQPIKSFFYDAANTLETGSDSDIDLIARPSEAVLDQFSQLNSELTAIQRELYKKNMDLEEVNKKLHILATTDSLTGLLNRREVFHRADLELERAKRENHQFGLALIDLDHFKEINDTYGHHMGDVTLIELAGLMQSSIRGYDAAGRIGGDEFLTFFSLGSKRQFRLIMERLLKKIQGMVLTTDDGVSFEPKASMGAFSFSPSQHEDIKMKDLLLRADEALYKSKELGGDQFTLIACEGPDK